MTDISFVRRINMPDPHPLIENHIQAFQREMESRIQHRIEFLVRHGRPGVPVWLVNSPVLFIHPIPVVRLDSPV